MKKYYFIIPFLIAFNCSLAQIINIPDAALKTRLLMSSISIGIAKDSNGNNMEIDANHDQQIQLSEALLVYKLAISSANITNITGISEFANLRELYSDHNQLTNHILDLSALSQLSRVTFRYDNLTDIIFPSPSLIKYMSFQDNDLTHVDLTGFSLLDQAIFSYNQLTSINFSGLDMILLDVSFNNLTQLDLSNFDTTNLYCSYNNITNLDISNSPNVKVLSAAYNNLLWLNFQNGTNFLSLNLSANPNIIGVCGDAAELSYLQTKLNYSGSTNYVLSSNCNLGENEVGFNRFSVIPNPAYDQISIISNQLDEIQSISIYDVTGRQILYTSKVKEYTDVSSLQTGTYVMRIYTDKEISTIRFIKK